MGKMSVSLESLGERTPYGTVIDEFPEPARKTKYPWSDWESGKVIVLKRGVDFDCSVESMIARIYGHARQADMFVRVARGLGKNVPREQAVDLITIQFDPLKKYASKRTARDA